MSSLFLSRSLSLSTPLELRLNVSISTHIDLGSHIDTECEDEAVWNGMDRRVSSFAAEL